MSSIMLPEPRVALLREVILDEIGKGGGRRRPTSAVALAAVGVVGVAGTAAAWVSRARPDDPYQGYCSASVSRDEATWRQHGFGVAENASGRRNVPDALSVCRELWRLGVVGAAAVPPELTACVVDGALVIYPGGADVCDRLQVPSAELPTPGPSGGATSGGSTSGRSGGSPP